MGGFIFISIIMNSLEPIFHANNILLNIPATSKKRAFEQVALMFENRYSLPRAEVFEKLFARERLGSTGLGHAVAIPHARITGLEEPIASFVRLAQPISFDSPDGQRVRFLFVILVPEEDDPHHLEILSCAAKTLVNQTLIDSLAEESDTDLIYEMIIKEAEKHITMPQPSEDIAD